MSVSAFGVEHPDIVTKRENQSPSFGRVATGAFFPGIHGAVAGKPGDYRKAKAATAEMVPSMVAGPVGAGLGTLVAHDAGWYKRQNRRKKKKK